MGETMKKYSIVFITLVMLALLGACENPFVKDIVPPAGPGSNANPTVFKVYIDFKGRLSGDSVTASSKSGKDGEEITLSYTLTNTQKTNRIEFSGTRTRIPSVEDAGTSTRQYFINKNDAVDGEITILAVFIHSIKPTGSAVSVPTVASTTINSITINAVTLDSPEYGQIAEYAISRTNYTPEDGWQTELTFSGLEDDTDYYIFARSQENDNYDAGEAKSVAIRTERAIKIDIKITGNETGDSVTASPVKGILGDTITLSYTLANTKLHNRLTFSGITAGIEEVDTAETSTRTFTIIETDVANNVITINAVFTHSDKPIVTMTFENGGNETKTYGSGSFTKTIAGGLTGISYNSSEPTVATVDGSGTVSILKVGSTTITATKPDDTNTYTPAEYLLTVRPKPVTITGLSAANKEYDGKTDAIIIGIAVIEGKLDGDTLILIDGTAAFANKNIGTGKTVTFSGYSLDGAAKDNYSLSQPASVTADITALQLTGDESVTTSKPYDGTTTAAVSFSATNKIATDALTVTVTGTYNAPTVAGANTINIVYTLSDTDAGNYIKPADHSVPGTITPATGSAVSVPKTASKTDTSITVRAVTLSSPNLGQTAEYAIGPTNSAPTTSWQDGLTFSGLTKGDVRYIFARSKANANCDAGAQQVSAAITVMDDSYRNTVIDFETAIPGITFTNGNDSPTVAVVADPANASQKSLRITTSGNGWNQAAVIPIYLPYALENYGSVSFRFRLLSVGGDPTPRSIQVYAAANTSTFVRYGFGNTSGNNFAANLVGGTPEVLFNDSYKNTWTEYEITITNPGNAIKDLVGNIYIAIGMNCNDVRDYLLDDITFLMSDTFDPPPFITPASAVFDKNAQSDIPVTVAFQGKTLSDIKKSGTALNIGTDYTVSGNTVTLKTSYLGTLPDGSTPLTFIFSNGATCTFTVNIGLLLKYDFSNGATIGAGYPKYGINNAESTAQASGLSAVIGASTASSGEYAGKTILRVIKTTGHSSPRFVLPFNVGSGGLTGYSNIILKIRPVSGDLNNSKTWYARAGFTATSFGNVSTNLGGTLQTTPATITIPLSGTSGYSGVVDIGFEVNNTSSFEYEIMSIELQ
jgi:hypothetical protein